MARYIDADALKLDIDLSKGASVLDMALSVLKAVKEAPTADVVPKSEVVNEFAEKVKPLFTRIVELMFDGNEPTCQVENCHKPDSIGCGDRICIDENIAWWKAKVDQIAKEIMEGNDEAEKQGNG